MRIARTLACLLTISAVSVPAYAVTVLNHNKYGVDFEIRSESCFVPYTPRGSLGLNGSYTWTRDSLFHPDRVCVWAAGVSSWAGGSYLSGLKNEGCVVEVVDDGFFWGVKVKKVSNCD